MNMFELTLTAQERRAFDWVGDRYNAGEVARILYDYVPEDREWSDDGDITFEIPRRDAREINLLASKEEPSYSWPCFSDRLTSKMNEFCEPFWEY